MRLLPLLIATVVGCASAQYAQQFRPGENYRPGAYVPPPNQRPPTQQNGFGQQQQQQPTFNQFGQVQNPQQQQQQQQQTIQQQQTQQQLRFQQSYQSSSGQFGSSGGGFGMSQQNNGFNQQQQLQPQQTATTPRSSLNNVNQPERLISAASANGAQIDIQIRSYSNTGFALSNDTICICPIAYCDFLDQNTQNSCKFSFVTVISSADQSVQYYASDFIPFTGNLDQSTPGNWSNAMSFQMTSKPVAVDIFVYHQGVVISRTGSLLYFNRLVLVDSFVVDVYSYDPSMNYAQPSTIQLSGKMLNTALTVSFKVSCINGMMGKMCNLNCNLNNVTQSPVSDRVICQDSTGLYSECQWTTGRVQATNCVSCVNGITANGTCADLFNTPVEAGVSYAFRTWTIVLGCLLGLALLVILCLIIAYIIIRNKEREDAQYNKYPIASASRPLVEDDEWSVPPSAPRRTVLPPVPDRDASRNSEDSYARNGQQRQEHQV